MRLASVEFQFDLGPDVGMIEYLSPAFASQSITNTTIP
jgi:hypothetical protein